MTGIHDYSHVDTTKLWLFLALNFLMDGVVILLRVYGG